jgi:tRNA pseudouridine55 synthase
VERATRLGRLAGCHVGVDMGLEGPSGTVGERPEGLVIVDKPAGWTSHDVVARVRKLARTRKVGHAGTLDPMATGVLVVGIGRATRLLGYIAGHDKAYRATIRLGWATVTDDAAGERISGAPAAGLTMDQVLPAVGALTGPILQRPSAVSAIKVAGRRAHDRVRAGETVELRERPVLVSVFDVLAYRADPEAGAFDLDVEVVCSSGTYVRALARDLGEALGVGGHLTALRRTRVGGFYEAEAHELADLEQGLTVIDLSTAARNAFPVLAVGPVQAMAVCNGRPIDLAQVWAPYRDLAEGAPDWSELVEPLAVLDEDGSLLALAAPNPDLTTHYLAVFGSPDYRPG